MDRQKRDAELPLWQLDHVDDVEYIPDNSGVHVLINWDRQTASCRLDIFATVGSVPLQSFAGTADNVRKHAMRWLFDFTTGHNDFGLVSLEHAAYIGAELEQADTERIDYVQN